MFCFFVCFSIVLRMDKEWMLADRLSTEYKKGVDSFLEFAIENVKDSNLIPCPCIKCGNL